MKHHTDVITKITCNGSDYLINRNGLISDEIRNALLKLRQGKCSFRTKLKTRLVITLENKQSKITTRVFIQNQWGSSSYSATFLVNINGKPAIIRFSGIAYHKPTQVSVEDFLGIDLFHYRFIAKQDKLKAAGIEQSLNPTELIDITIQLFLQLKEQKDPHADIKPGNILIKKDQDTLAATLIDQGEFVIYFSQQEIGRYKAKAKAIATIIKASRYSYLGYVRAIRICTRTYLAPEIRDIDYRNFTKKSDMYSLGLTLLATFFTGTYSPIKQVNLDITDKIINRLNFQRMLIDQSIQQRIKIDQNIQASIKQLIRVPTLEPALIKFLSCLHDMINTDPKQRPSVEQALTILQKLNKKTTATTPAAKTVSSVGETKRDKTQQPSTTKKANHLEPIKEYPLKHQPPPRPAQTIKLSLPSVQPKEGYRSKPAQQPLVPTI